MLEIGFENTYFQVFQGFTALKETRAHIQPNGQFWTIFGQNGQNGIFFKKAFGTFFSLLKALINCKVSEKSNERFTSNSVTDVRRYTVGRESLGLQRLRRETKKLANSNERIAKKNAKNLHFWPKRPILDIFWLKWQKGIFLEKVLGTFFSHLKALTNCKVSEKSNERFSSNSVTYIHTHVRTHARTDVNP